MSVRIGDQVLQLAEDYGAAIDVLGDQMAANTTAAARSSLNALLGKLRRSYLRFLDEGTPSSTTAQGAPRRPLEYTIRETTARYADLLKISEEFLPDAEIKALEKVYRKDLAAAIGKGGELQAQLASLVDRRRATPFAGPDPQVVKAAAERTSAFIRGVSAEFRESLTRITLDGVAQGRGYKALTKDIRQLLGGPGFQQRAELIARSELANAYVQAQKQYAQAGGYRYVRWIAVGDERTCATCGSRSGRIFRTDEVSGTAHPRCVLPDTPVSPGLTAGAMRSMYRGDVVSVTLQDGQVFTVTANHPMLTARGIVKASALRDGDQLLKERLTGDLGGVFPGPDFNQGPAAAEDVFAAFAGSCGVTTSRVPATAMDLHGDGASLEADVDVVRAQGLLQYRLASPVHQGVEQGQHERPRPVFHPFSGVGDLDALRLCLNAASRGLVGWRDHGLTLLRGGLRPAEQHGLATAAWRDPQLSESPGDSPTVDTELLSDSLDALAGHVALVNVVQIKIAAYHGPVYTFDTMAGVYPVSVGIMTGNCRCVLSAVPNEAVEEEDPELRAVLSDQAFWEQHQKETAETLQKSLGWDVSQVEAKIRQNLTKPTASERRLYPDIKRSAQPVG